MSEFPFVCLSWSRSRKVCLFAYLWVSAEEQSRPTRLTIGAVARQTKRRLNSALTSLPGLACSSLARHAAQWTLLKLFHLNNWTQKRWMIDTWDLSSGVCWWEITIGKTTRTAELSGLLSLLQLRLRRLEWRRTSCRLPLPKILDQALLKVELFARQSLHRSYHH